jgi:hypothetical protein
VAEGLLHFIADRKQRGRQEGVKDNIPLRTCPPVIYFLLLNPTT